MPSSQEISVTVTVSNRWDSSQAAWVESLDSSVPSGWVKGGSTWTKSIIYDEPALPHFVEFNESVKLKYEDTNSPPPSGMSVTLTNSDLHKLEP